MFVPNNHFSFEMWFCFSADDMGLGKTLTMIALILSSEAELEKNLDSEDSIQNIDSNDFSARNSMH